MPRLIDLTGMKFGRLLVLEKADSLKGRTRWLCQCDCGKKVIIHGTSLKTGNTKSCGCYKTENAKKLYSTSCSKDKTLYMVWNSMKQRCYNKNNTSFNNYGGRGITICQKWLDDYENFYIWAISHGYEHGLEIDRIDNDKGYSPDNCIWTTHTAQANNKRNNVRFEINGITRTLSEWCRLYNIDYYLVRQRVLKLHWDIKTALETPKQIQKKKY